MKGVDSSLDTLPKIGAPATRALNNAGYPSLRDLAGVPRAELAKLHGMGPKALETIQSALAQRNLSLG
ncbi:helix-hairpin-helix domain-containing protein [Micromonospora sp. KLBMP9576]|uniref:helix-hairpin-helix domain-containing protein n=1 Tax=Micromonospora sp. KLBMP9576 TaxID=3424769 RepID=UPI003D8B4E32